MKLLNCLECHDILSILLKAERSCRCGKSSAIHPDIDITEFSGPARIIHISNEDYSKAKADINTSYGWKISFEGRTVVRIQPRTPERMEDTVLDKLTTLMSKCSEINQGASND